MTVSSQFDVAGNVIKVIDGKSYIATYDFSDRFGVPDSEARENRGSSELGTQVSYAFPTLFTNQMGHTTYVQYDYYIGRPVNSEDPNGVISSASYADILNRTKQLIYAVNDPLTKRQTSFDYDDSNRIITTTSDLNTFGDNLLERKEFFDKLGRKTETHQYESNTTYIISTQTYDELSRIKRAYNPYRATSDSTYGWTEYTYDALSRITRVESFDLNNNSVGLGLISYAGNEVTATDSTGRKKKSITDASGRLSAVIEDPEGLNYQTTYT